MMKKVMFDSVMLFSMLFFGNHHLHLRSALQPSSIFTIYASSSSTEQCAQSYINVYMNTCIQSLTGNIVEGCDTCKKSDELLTQEQI